VRFIGLSIQSTTLLGKLSDQQARKKRSVKDRAFLLGRLNRFVFGWASERRALN